MNTVTEDYDKNELISVIELSKLYGINKRFVLDALRTEQLEPIAKVATGKKGAPKKLYVKSAAELALLKREKKKQELRENRATMSLLLGDDDERDSE
mgnify:FL=1